MTTSTTDAHRSKERALGRDAEVRSAILATASAHVAADGAAALSLRAVARDLGMASSAVYRYFASRDELLTALIIEAYDSLGEHTEAAVASTTDRRAGRTVGDHGHGDPRVGGRSAPRLCAALRHAGPRLCGPGRHRRSRNPGCRWR